MTGFRSRDRLAGLLGLAVTLLAALLVLVILVFLLSSEPWRTLAYFFSGPVQNIYSFGNWINAAVPLILTGLGISLAFRASVFNLGGEGQVYTGGVVATALLLALPHLPGPIGIGAALLAAAAAGGLVAGLSGFFRMRWNTDALISSFLISKGLILVVDYIVTGPLKDPETNLLTTPRIAPVYRLGRILPPSLLDLSLPAVLAAALLVALYLFRTRQGYELRITGLNREFARYGGIDTKLYLVLPMILSGAFHGSAGAVSILGTYHRCLKGFSGGMGWNGIAVALIARNNPLAVIPAAIFFAYIEAGAKAAMLHSDMTMELAAVMQGVIFFLITAQGLYHAIRRRLRRGYV